MACDLFWPGSNIFRVAVVVVTFPLCLFGAIIATGYDVRGGQATFFPVDATHVPTFYSPRHRYNRFCHIFFLSALASIFGGIHCVGWNFSFPSYFQQMLWRVASLAVAILPLIALPICIFVAIICKCILHHTGVFKLGFTLANAVAVPIYLAARIILLGQAIALLRHLPPTALKAINWAQYYPHFF